MAKRVADNYLTDQNWDQEYVAEESGHFTTADQDVLKGRVIKKARRRTNKDNSSTDGAGVFSGFGGLKSANTTQATGFSFGGNAKTSFGFGVKKTEGTEENNGTESKGAFTGFSFKKSNIESTGSQGFKGFNLTPKQSETTDTSTKTDGNNKEEESSGFQGFGGFKTNKEPATSSAGGFQGFNFAKAKQSDEKQPQVKQLVGQSVDSILKGNFTTTSTSPSTSLFKIAKPAAINSAVTNKDQPSMSTFKTPASETKTDENKDSDKLKPSSILFGKTVEEKTLKRQDKDDKDIKVAEKKHFSAEKDDSAEYERHLSALNKCVSKWISDHVNEDSVCDLTPIFNDYQKYIKEITQKYGSENDQMQTSLKPTPQASTLIQPQAQEKSPQKCLFKVKTTPPNVEGDKPPQFGIQKSPSTKDPQKAPLFKGFGTGGESKIAFGGKPTEGDFKGFSFNSSMVNNSAPPKQQQPAQNSTNSDEYVPPKNECDIVEEKDAFYTKKCKLFYVKEGNYIDKGVGHLHLKPVPDSSKTQLIVRANNSLGNLLLNIMINSAMPVNKQGKNNVMFSCVSNPPIDESEPNKVILMLVRVKTSDDADELLKIIEEKKKEV